MSSGKETKTLSRILVWDLPTRIFHWGLVLCFSGAMITQDIEQLRLVHNTFGYTMLGLVGFRLIWGFIGTRYARFVSFVPSPRQVMDYLGGFLEGRPIHTVGHNPVGAVAILAMLALTIGAGTSGILLDVEIAEEIFDDVHETFANFLLALAAIHVIGVMFSSIISKENLVKAMITGFKIGTGSQGIRSSIGWVGLLISVTVAAYWLLRFWRS